MTAPITDERIAELREKVWMHRRCTRETCPPRDAYRMLGEALAEITRLRAALAAVEPVVEAARRARCATSDSIAELRDALRDLDAG